MTIQAFGQLITIGLYIFAAVLLWRRLEAMQHDPANKKLRKPAALAALAGLVAHALSLAPGLFDQAGLSLGIASASSLVAAVIVALYLVTYTRKPVANLGLILLPIAALAVFFNLVSKDAGVSVNTTPLATLHIAISLLAYGFLAIAAAQGILLLFQEHLLKGHHPGGVLRSLPPLQAVEILMFQLIGIGFAMLTLTLVSGIFFSEAVFGQAFRFNHHIVLSIGGWAVFAVLLIGRRKLGWRGTIASSWTLVGFSLLLLAYFGTKFVAEVLLQKAG